MLCYNVICYYNVIYCGLIFHNEEKKLNRILTVFYVYAVYCGQQSMLHVICCNNCVLSPKKFSWRYFCVGIMEKYHYIMFRSCHLFCENKFFLCFENILTVGALMLNRLQSIRFEVDEICDLLTEKYWIIYVSNQILNALWESFLRLFLTPVLVADILYCYCFLHDLQIEVKISLTYCTFFLG